MHLVTSFATFSHSLEQRFLWHPVWAWQMCADRTDELAKSTLSWQGLCAVWDPWPLSSPGPTCHPTQTPACSCAASHSCCVHPTSAVPASLGGGRDPVRTPPCLRSAPAPPGPANCWAKAALRASCCSVGRAGRAAEDFGGRVKLAAGDDSPARYGLRASFLRQRGRGPAREGCQVPEQLGEHPLCLPSGQCLGWAWLGKPAESLGTEAKLPLGLGGGEDGGRGRKPPSPKRRNQVRCLRTPHPNAALVSRSVCNQMQLL